MDWNGSQHYTLRWNNYLGNLGNVFASLLQRELLVDVTLTAEGRSIKCHKVVLSACSPYFEQLFLDTEAQHPIIILKDIRWLELQHIVEYMYCGQISVLQQDIEYILEAAESLQVRGLVNLTGEDVVPQPRKSFRLPSEGEDLRSSEVTPQKKRRLTHSDSTLISSSLSPSLSPSPLHLSSPTQSETTSDLIKSDPEDLRVPSLTPVSSRQEGSKVPTWTQTQLQEAIEAVITQRMRFTQASSKYGIPKGTLYDNILGKSKRMQILDDLGLIKTEELAVLEYCCEVSNMPYNRRTSKSLRDIISFITVLRREAGNRDFTFSMRQGFRWWWAFTKKHSIISLYYENHQGEEDNKKAVKPLTSSGKTPVRACTPLSSGNPENTVLNLSTTPLSYPQSFSLLAPLLSLSSPYSAPRC